MKTLSLLTALACITLNAMASAFANEPPSDATRVIERHLEAVGGHAAVESKTSLTISGVFAAANPNTSFTLQIKSPGRVRFAASDAAGKPICYGRDSRARFWQQDANGVRDLEPARAAQLMELVLALFPAGQADLGERLADAICTRTIENDVPVVMLGRKQPGPFPVLIFDEASGLLLQIGDSTLADYRTAGQVKLPHHIRWSAKTELRLTSVSFDQINDVSFERPGARGGWLAQLAPGRGVAPTQLHTKLSSPGLLEVVRQPSPAKMRRGRLHQLPTCEPGSGASWQVDLRGADLTRLDLSSRLTDLAQADFDSNTRWPESLPTDFNPQHVLRLGQDPGLGVRSLHARGITGKGVGIGIIDQTLLVNHEEYAQQLRLYEEIHCPTSASAQMHGPAVASIAVGKTCGVAPAADLYYIAEQHGEYRRGNDFEWDFTPLAQSVDRLLDINRALPANGRIRVIATSVGWTRDQKGYAEIMAAVRRATEAGVFVISTSLRDTHHLRFDGLGRDPFADPNTPASYRPGAWWATQFWNGQMRFKPGTRLCVPMDARSTASPSGPHDYVHYANGGWSWCVPWIAGLYALACQVDPDITPERFWSEALRSGTTISIVRESEQARLGTISNPLALLERLALPELRPLALPR